MGEKTFKDLLKSSRSYRGYDESRKVARGELADMVDCARYAPSSINIQPFRYYLACEEEIVSKIQAQTIWARGLPQLELPHKGHYPTAFIVICQDTKIAESIPRFQKDAGIVAQTILLSAAEKGLGGCMIASFNAGEIVKALDLAPNLKPVLVVAIGKPDETVVLTEAGADGKTAYYRDENDVHYVPKRSLEDILL